VATLSTRALNRALLARQLLLERADLPIPDALSCIGGIQNQYAPNAYLRLWSCLAEFRRDDLTRAYEEATVVQGTLMRGTIHTVAAADYHPMVMAIARTQREWAERVTRTKEPVDHEAHIRKVRDALAAGPMRRPDLIGLLEEAPRSVRYAIDIGAEIVRLPPSGTWERRRADLCGLADDLVEHAEIDETSAIAWLIARYLAAFGPASAADVASFIGMKLAPVRQIAASLELRRLRTDDGTEVLDVDGAPLPDPETPAPVRFLPTWDAILLVHARRTQVLLRRIGRWASTRRCPRRIRRSSSRARWRAPGAGTTGGSSWRPSAGLRAESATRSMPRRRAWLPCMRRSIGS
jgi:hypothetical protein